MTNQETRNLLKACRENLMKIKDESEDLNIDQAWDLFKAIEGIESLLNDFQLITHTETAVVGAAARAERDQLLNACKQ